MKIGMVLSNPGGLRTDIRVIKEARALCAAGYDVGILCDKLDSDEPDLRIYTGGARPFQATFSTRDSSQPLPNWVTWAFGEPLRKREWSCPIRVFVEKFQPQVLHCHDLDMVCTTLTIAQCYGLPLVADLHENMPALRLASVSWRGFAKRMMFRLTLNYRRLRAIEKSVLLRCKKIIVVVPEAAHRITQAYSIPAERVVVVSNTEDETTFEDGIHGTAILEHYKAYWVAAYTGGAGPHRGIDTAIRAAAIAGPHIPDFRLVVVGVREKSRRALLTIAEHANATEFVELVDWVPTNMVSSYVGASKVCLVPHNDFEHTQTTVPHKLFQYMIMGKPVVVSSCAPLKRIVEDTQAGRVFPTNEAAALAQCLIDLYRGGNGYLDKLGENGRRAALGPYAWRHDATRLVAMYKRLETEVPASLQA